MADFNLLLVEIRRQVSPFYGGERFSVRNNAFDCLNINGGWEYEPQPSERDQAFYDRCRFPSFEAAIQSLAKAEQTKS